ncbi:MAG: glycosyltransferase, partial [Solirubrobacterales bacterium]
MALGKFLFAGEEKLYLRGVTYGTFRPGEDGSGYPDSARVEADFRQMALSGVNSVRTYSVPPGHVLDAAAGHGLRVLVGLPWEQHVAFLADRALAGSIEQRVREGIRACAGHPAVLGYAVGNEIPAPIVRWHGRRRVERFLRRLYEAAKDEDPDGLVTYVNFPTTEYLQLPFLDFHCFNVYLESDRQLESYLARLQNVAGDRPLVMAEIGLDSRRHGEERQAESVEGQVRLSFAAGCAGAFVFAWTDEWHRGGYEVEDWDFGLTDRHRRPKAALAAVRRAFREVPFAALAEWPKVSVVVCARDGADTLRWCLEGLRGLDYPDYEVIVVDDGSTDGTAVTASESGFPAISTPNRGLSSARNTGLEAASGEIVAYLDCDARPDRDWLRYLAAAFRASDHAGIGGPNVPPPDGWVADCVANAPGGPVHVLLSDRE